MEGIFTSGYVLAVAAGFIVLSVIAYVYVRRIKRQSTEDIGTQKDGPEFTKVQMKTDKGDMILELRQDLMPVTVNNFMKLVHSRFYNGMIFHRVEPFLIQSGDPTAIGLGAPQWSIKFEIHRSLKHKKYAVGMARLKELNTASSQFYILKRDVKSLDGKYAIFGRVKQGFDVVDEICKGDRILDVREI